MSEFKPSAHSFSCFVTGTDTGVGKTLFSVALLHTLARRYQSVVGMKPVAAGMTAIGQVWGNEDILALRAASTVQVPHEMDNPVLLPAAVSPHIAAQHAGMQIDIAHVVRCHHDLQQRADAVVVEGAGGFCVPLSETKTGADLAQALNVPLVLVVGLRLGCLNHALLTAQAIAARGLRLMGWVANQLDPTMLAQEENIAYLQSKLAAPLLAKIPHQEQPDARKVVIELP